MSLPASLKAKIAAETRAKPSPTRQEQAWRTTMGIAVGVAVAAIFFGSGAGPTMGERAPMFVWVTALVLVALAARTLIAGVSGSLRGSVAASKRIAVMPYVVLGAIVIAYAAEESLPHSFAGDVPCGVKTMLLSAIVGGAAIFARRGTEPIRPGVKALLLGSFAAAVGATMVFLACPLEEPVHFLVGHLGGAVLVGGVIGGVAVRVIGTK